MTQIRLKGKVHALDSICYRAGGPLGAGDIKDINAGGSRVSCVRCPWHHYLLSLVDGQKWYSSLEFQAGKLMPAG